MRLNEQIPGLPQWPSIEQNEQGEITVSSRHLTHARFLLGRNSGIFLALASAWLCYLLHDWRLLSLDASAFIGTCAVGYFVFRGAMDGGRAIARDFFETDVVVTFKPGAVVIDGREWNTQIVKRVDFISLHRAMSEDAAERLNWKIQKKECSPELGCELRFKKIEMLHGDNPVLVTTLDSEERAQTYVLALQAALALSQASKLAPASQKQGSSVAVLPE